jgi:hypothetical protein
MKNKLMVVFSIPVWERTFNKMSKFLAKRLKSIDDIEAGWMLVILIALITIIGGIVKLFIA